MNLQLTRNNINSALVLTFSTAFAPLVGSDQRNFLVIFMCILASAALLLTRRFPRQVFLIYLFAVYALVVNLVNHDTVRWSSFFYTALFLSSYAFYTLKQTLDLAEIHKLSTIIYYLIFAYAIVGLIQYISLLTGIEPINGILYGGPLRQNMLSVEPSHAALTISMLYIVHHHLVHLVADSRERQKKVLYAAIAAVAGIAFSGSSMGVLAILAIFVTLYPMASLFLSPIVLILLSSALWLSDWEPTARLFGFLGSLPSANAYTIAAVDHSASIRLQPVLVYVRDINFGSLEFWFGSGASSQLQFLFSKIIGAPDLWVSGFIPGALIDYGLIGVAIFFLVVFPFRIIRVSPVLFVYFLLFMTTHWFNSQIFWLFLFFAHTLIVAERFRASSAHLSEPGRGITLLRYKGPSSGLSIGNRTQT